MPSADGTPILLAAFDKFRGTVSARTACDAALAAAEVAGVVGLRCPLADGGEGTLDAVGGHPVHSSVTGPLGDAVDAEWRLLDPPQRGGRPTAVIEMARAAGLSLVGGPAGNDPVAASTRGVGELIRAAADAGAGRIVVGCGGSATTDGGAGALEVVGPEDLLGIELLGACDVETPFVDAATVFGPQKGAGAEAIALLTERLETLGLRYQEQYGVDVTALPRAGAAGGLGGALVALGGALVSGFDLVAAIVGFPAALAQADIVVTGEGRLDVTSLSGKVVGEVVARARGHARVLVVAGDAAEGVLADEAECTVVSLTRRFGVAASRTRTAELISRVVRAELRGLGW